MTEMVSHLTLYTVINFQEGQGMGEQHVLASSVESAIEIFYKANQGARLDGVKVGDQVIHYGCGYESDKPEST